MAINGVLLGGQAVRDFFRVKSLEKHIEYFSLLGPMAKLIRRVKMGPARGRVFDKDMNLQNVYWDAVLYRDEEGTPHLVTMFRTMKHLPPPRGTRHREELPVAEELKTSTLVGI
jgi:hypothetical protein